MHLFSSRISFIYSAISNPRVCVKFFFCFVLFSFLFCSCSSRSDMCRFVHSFDAHRGAICFCFVIAIVYFVTYKSGQFFFEVMFRMFLFWILFLGHNSIVCNFFLFSSFDLYTHTHSALLLFSSTLCDVVWSASLFAKLAVNSSFGVVVVLTLKNQSTFCWMLFFVCMLLVLLFPPFSHSFHC